MTGDQQRLAPASGQKPSDGAVLVCERLAVTYNRNAVGIEDVSLRVRQGQIIALVGPNGAGKTTTLRAVSGFLRSEAGRVSGGTVSLFGDDLSRMQPHQVARLGVALVPEQDKIFRSLTVEENLLVPTSRGSGQADIISFALGLFPRLTRRWKTHAGYLSGGERQMLGISMALANVPKLLLADELSQGLAPLIVSEIMEAVTRIRSELDMSVLLVEQNVRSALRIADYVHVIERGRISWQGSPEEARSDEAFTRVYLGLGE